MLNALLDLVLPPACAGCGAKGASCCPRCFQALTAEPARRSPAPRPYGLPDCWSAAPYEGAVRRMIVAYKERGAVALAGVLAEAVTRTVLVAMGQAGEWAGGRFAVVPVPSARRSVRGRGHDPVGKLAVLVAARLRALGLGAEVWPGLGQAGRVADQAGLSRAQRAANLAGSLRVLPAANGPPASRALLLDDIVTTGATLAEAARALHAAEMVVPLAVTAGATRRRS
ncbi:ComF family protein [Nonomuraea rubra]|uniref:ComF family protein n=1 Tax=Nonomuraea rubra TaxID=46180 RepID=UPI0033D2A309